MKRKQDYHYELPEQLIAQQPLEQRSNSRLLHLDTEGTIADLAFHQLLDILQAGDLVVMNNTQVIPARLFGRKPSGGQVEILVERILDDCTVLAHLRASKALNIDQQILLNDQDSFTITNREQGLYQLVLQSDRSIHQVLEASGHIPLPPYIKRADTLDDQTRYQTVFASQPGAVAAPTAGLHFDQALLNKLHAKDINTGYITLHVGAGTFQSMRVDKLSEHSMHSERIEVDKQVIEQIRACKAQGGRVFAVGTTVIRALETASLSGKLLPYSGETDLFITPGFEFHCVDCLITNFHVPESTLLVLVCAFGGYQRLMQAYQHAIDEQYRFFSYGDAMLIEKT